MAANALSSKVFGFDLYKIRMFILKLHNIEPPSFITVYYGQHLALKVAVAQITTRW